MLRLIQRIVAAIRTKAPRIVTTIRSVQRAYADGRNVGRLVMRGGRWTREAIKTRAGNLTRADLIRAGWTVVDFGATIYIIVSAFIDDEEEAMDTTVALLSPESLLVGWSAASQMAPQLQSDDLLEMWDEIRSIPLREEGEAIAGTLGALLGFSDTVLQNQGFDLPNELNSLLDLKRGEDEGVSDAEIVYIVMLLAVLTGTVSDFLAVLPDELRIGAASAIAYLEAPPGASQWLGRADSSGMAAAVAEVRRVFPAGEAEAVINLVREARI